MNWRTCGSKLCVTPVEAKKELRNKVKVGRWMTSAKAIIHYYRAVTAPAANSKK